MAWNAAEQLNTRKRRKKFKLAFLTSDGREQEGRARARTKLDQNLTRRLSLNECLEADLPRYELRDDELISIRLGGVDVPAPFLDMSLLGSRVAEGYVMVDKQKLADVYLMLCLDGGTRVHRYFLNKHGEWQRLHGALTTLLQNGFHFATFRWENKE
jgi:hypothetical protein